MPILAESMLRVLTTVNHKMLKYIAMLMEVDLQVLPMAPCDKCHLQDVHLELYKKTQQDKADTLKGKAHKLAQPMYTHCHH